MTLTRTLATTTLAIFLLNLVSPGLLQARHRRGRTPRTGTLEIICGVDGARYVLDEGQTASLEGITPAESIELPVGPHTIRVSKEGYLPFSEVFDIEAGYMTEMEVELVLYSGRLRVTATPPPVEIQVDGKVMGSVPVETDISIGEHVVRLSKPGYVEEIRRVGIMTGRTTELDVTLLPIEEVQKAAGGKIHKKWWFWTVLVTVAAGVVIPSVLLTRKGSEPAPHDAEVILP